MLAIVLLLLATKGYCDCDLNSLTIGTTRSGNTRQGEPEWKVQVINNCGCPISNLILTCKGFASAEPVNPSLFRQINGTNCIVNSGNAIPPKASISFFYAWNSPTILFPASLTGHCPN
ncbi:Protein TAPETUM DETERMINANT 1 [Linum grandiflorum]